MPLRPAAMETLVVRESRKASRMWVNHAREPHHYPEPDRLRWLDYRRRGIDPPDWQPRYRIPVQFAVDEREVCGVEARLPVDYVMASSFQAPVSTTSWWHSAPTMTASDPISRFTGTSGRSAPPADDPSSPERTRPRDGGDCSIMAELRNGFRRFLAPFCGPATSHLPAYTSWFTTRLAADRAVPNTL